MKRIVHIQSNNRSPLRLRHYRHEFSSKNRTEVLNLVQKLQLQSRLPETDGTMPPTRHRVMCWARTGQGTSRTLDCGNYRRSPESCSGSRRRCNHGRGHAG